MALIATVAIAYLVKAVIASAADARRRHRAWTLSIMAKKVRLRWRSRRQRFRPRTFEHGTGIMKKIEAIIKPFKLDELEGSPAEVGIQA